MLTVEECRREAAWGPANRGPADEPVPPGSGATRRGTEGRPMSLSRPDLERLAEELAAAHTRWGGIVSHTAGPRSYARVWESDEVNAWLICWGERHDTGWHDHDDSAAAITVL